MLKRNVAVVLAAGQGKRMQSSVHKQYLLMGENRCYFTACGLWKKVL